jgi:mRNA interferase MazF
MVVPGDLGRLRPGIVVQGDKFNAGLSTIFVCPVSSDLQDGLSLRRRALLLP